MACGQQKSPVIARAGLEKPLVALAFVFFVLFCFYYPALTTANAQTAGALLARAKRK